MARDTEGNKTGDKGELMAELLLSEVACVNPYRRDKGLDFMCELRGHAGVTFYIQAKGSSAPTYTKTTISSLPVDCKTIEEYWFKKRDPVFVLMSDVTANKSYFVLVNQDTYKPRSAEQKTYTFSIPLSNEITLENIGNFVMIVMHNQRNVNQEEVERFLEEHYEKNPELYHDLDAIDRFLEVMRGSDQEAQVETKLLLKRRFEAGTPTSSALVHGLISIFINCKDRITQTHLLDSLVILKERAVIPEILKQIERNLRLYEYRLADESRRHTYITFLFDALVRLQASNVLEEMKHFLGLKDINVNRDAIRAIGDLKLNGAIPDIMVFLNHPDDAVRCDVARTLSKLSTKKVARELKRGLKASEDKLKLAGIIQTLAESKNAQVTAAILPFAGDSSRDVRKAVALYLGTINPMEHIQLLLHLMMNDDYKVRSEARRSIGKCLQAHAQKMERLVLPLLKKAYENGQVLDVASLMSFCTGPYSRPTILEIYRKEEGLTLNFKFYGPDGNWEATQPVNLKTQALEILKRIKPSEIQADIIKHIQSTDDSTRVKHIIAAGEMKLAGAFSPLLSQLSKEKTWVGFVVSSLVSIDHKKIRAWAVERLRSNPSLELTLICFDIIYRTGPEKQETGLIKEQIRRLMNDHTVRHDRRIYDYVDRYKVRETSPLIVNDLKTVPIEFHLGCRMFKTLAVMKSPEGRELIIDALNKVEDIWKHHFIELLGNIGDVESITAVAEYSDHPDPEISKLVKRILSNISKE